MWVCIMVLLIGLVLFPLLYASPALLLKYDKDLEELFPLIKKQNCSRVLKNGTRYFPSRRSLSLTVLTWLLNFAFWIKAALDADWKSLLFLLIIAALFVWMDESTGYIITDAELIVKCRIFRFSINLATIKEVTRTNNPLSAPALSLKRLELMTSDGKLVLISPVEEEFFLRLLEERAINLKIILASRPV